MTDTTDESPLQAADYTDSTCEAVSTERMRRPIWLTIAGLIVGIASLGLAVVPPLAMGRGLPNPFAEPKEEKPPAEPPAEREGGVTLKYKNFSINVGGKNAKKDEKPVEQKVELTKDPAHWFMISAVGAALAALLIAAIAQIRERHTGITVCSMGVAAAAITWQYVAIGIAVGAAAAVFLVLIAILGQAVAG
jgi:hypothetical protein